MELVEGLVKREDKLEELDDAHVIGKSSLELLREVLPLVHADVDYVWRRRDLNLEGHVVPQVLELHRVVVLGVVPRYLVHLGVGMRALPFHVGVVVTVLVLAQKPLWFDIVDALESWCYVED